MSNKLDSKIIQAIARGVAIPAHLLALTKERRLDERRQRALSRYYIAAGVGGLAVGVHTTQFAIRDARIGLYKPVLGIGSRRNGPGRSRRLDSFGSHRGNLRRFKAS